MNKKDTKAFSDQTVEFQMSEWTSSAGTDGFYFTVIEGADFGRVFLLEKQETVIGRSDEADIQVDDEKVSRKHLKLMLMSNQKGEQWAKVVDLGSKNGIYINGARVFDHDLKTNDKLKVGDTILKFEIKDRLDVSYHDKLYQQATRDPLTGLSNRNHFQNEFRKFISIAARYNRPISIIMLDIDFFKKINDTYGHDVGDSVLKEVAKIIMHHVRNHDVAARFGGEEFVMLLPETAISGAVVVAERIRVALENKDFVPMGCHHRVTISIGIGEYPSSGLEGDEIIKRADEALYQAKSGGRNRVCAAQPGY